MNKKINKQKPDYQLALASIKSVLDFQYKKVPDVNDEKIQNKLKEAILNSKKKQIITTFYQKLKKGVLGREVPPDFQQKWQRIQTVEGVKGIILPQPLEHFLLLFHLLSVIVLIVISTFNGFIDNFVFTESENVGVYIAKAVPLLFKVLHFLMILTKQTFANGQDVIFLKQIVKNYVTKVRFYFDIAAIVLNCLVIALPTVMGISMAFFFVLLFILISCGQDLTRLEISYLKSPRQKLFWSLVKIAIFNIMFAHFIATVLLGMARYDLDENWITATDSDIRTTPWFDIYVLAFYWATTIMMTVGFGDLLPNTIREQYTTAFIQIFSCIVLAYNISEIGNIVSKLRQSNEKIMTKMAIFESMLSRQRNNIKKFNKQNAKKLEQSSEKDKKSVNIESFKQIHALDPLLEKRIYNFIRQSQAQNEHYQHKQQQQLVQSLPEHLKSSYYRQANKAIFTQVFFFRNLKPETLENLAESIRSRYFYAGEYINVKGKEIVILEEGTVGLGYRKRGSDVNGTIIDKIVQKNTDSPILIRNQFLSLKKQSNYDIISLSSSFVWELSLDALTRALEDSIIDNQFYFSILHKNNYNDEYWNIMECKRCHLQRHTSFECPKLHYMPLRTEVFFKNKYSAGKQQQRKLYIRKKLKTKQSDSLRNKKKLFDISQKFYKYQSGQLQQYEEKEYIMERQVNSNKKRFNANNTLLTRVNERRFQSIMQQAISQFHTGYRDQFWDLQVDVAENYLFYFLNQNPNRLILTKLSQVPMYGYHNQQEPQSIMAKKDEYARNFRMRALQ